MNSGFHGARMAQIAREARMSPGHIYHYFESKERMIEEIVRCYVERKIEHLKQLREGEGSVTARIIDGLVNGVATHADPFWSRLTLEITAEAARNEQVLKIVREADARLQREFAQVLAGEVDLEPSDPRIDVFVALLQGLGVRTIRKPDLDVAAITPLVQQTLQQLLERPLPAPKGG